MKKLVLFGDSLFGRVGKPRLLMLEQALKDYDVYNCAAGGWDTNDCAKKAPYLARLEPDVLVLSLGTNDACPWKLVPLETFKENLPLIFKAFGSSKVVYFLPPPVDESGIMKDGKQLKNERVRPYYEAAKEVCQTAGVAYVDSFEIFMPMLESGQNYHEDDGVHLEDIAYEKLADELNKILS